MSRESEEFRKIAHEAVDWIADYLDDARNYRVLPDMLPGQLVDRLPTSAPEQGEPLADIVKDFHEQVLPAVTHWNHPRFMSYFACTSSPPAVLAEMFSAALNTNGIQWLASPAVTELELVAMNWLRQWLGLSESWFGLIFDTASISTLHAIIAAREFVVPESHKQGVGHNLTVYASEHAHSSVEKAVTAAGFGQENFRKIPGDDHFRLRMDLLEAAVEADVRAGKRPCCFVPTIGTTSSTSSDPVQEIAALAARHNAWVHVDAAYAGSAAVIPEMQFILNGVENCHSMVMNPHKWLFVPLDLSALFTRYPDALRSAYSLVPEYLRGTGNTREVSLMEYGIPLGRRFRSLKMWFTMRYYGRERITAMLRDHIEMARELGRQVEAHPQLELIAPVWFSLVCFRVKGDDGLTNQLYDRLNASGEVFISKTVLDGKPVIRVAIGNAQTNREDVRAVWELIQRETTLLS